VPDAEALTGIDHVEVLRRAAQVASDIGEVHRTLSLVSEALDELGATGDPDRRARLMERRASALLSAGRMTQAIDVLRQAAELLPTDGHTTAAAAVSLELGNAMVRSSRWDEANDLCRRAATAARAAGADRQLVEAEVSLAVLQLMRGDHTGGMAAGRAAIDAALRLGHASAAMRGYINLSDTLERLGRSEDAAQLAAEGRLIAERSGYARSTGAFLAGNEAESLTRLGRLDEADRMIGASLASDPEGIFAATLLEVRCQISVRQGRFDRARQDIARARAMLGDQAELQFTRAFAVTEAYLRIHDDDMQAALAGLRADLSGPDSEPRYDWYLLWLALSIHAGEAERARDEGEPAPCLDPVFERVPENLGPDADPQRAFRAMCAAQLDRAQGRHVPGAWHVAAAQWRALQRPYELSECLFHAGRERVLTEDRDGAERDLVEAFGLASGIGAAPLAEQIARFARQHRLPIADLPAEPASSPTTSEVQRFGLTHRELEVLAMVADGRTNPEIAKALVISPKTASVHVSNILAKLGVASRVEAATLAHRLGLAAG
jgi:ATP/maltotriose-dependent transcriptional regulator MalT